VYETLKRILNALVTDLMEEIHRQVAKLGAATPGEIGLDEIRRAPRRLVALSPEMEAARATAKEFLYANLYNSPDMEEDTRTPPKSSRGCFPLSWPRPTDCRDHRAQISTKAWPAPSPTTSPA